MSSKIPTTVFGFVLYNLFALTTVIWGREASVDLGTVAFIIPLPSDAIWTMFYGDIFICLIMVAIFMEVVRQASGEISKPQTHMISLSIFVLSLVEFLLFEPFGNSVFFIFLLATLIDFVVTWLSTIIRARRDIRLTGGGPQS